MAREIPLDRLYGLVAYRGICDALDVVEAPAIGPVGNDADDCPLARLPFVEGIYFVAESELEIARECMMWRDRLASVNPASLLLTDNPRLAFLP